MALPQQRAVLLVPIASDAAPAMQPGRIHVSAALKPRNGGRITAIVATTSETGSLSDALTGCILRAQLCGSATRSLVYPPKRIETQRSRNAQLRATALRR